ncbi:MAG: hypothetical protein MUC36_16270 [Planctomycetes bacterium]|nr:hypothetical protein [Planctomycetota bacterium]
MPPPLSEWRQLELEVQGEPAVQTVQLEPLPTVALQVVDAEGRARLPLLPARGVHCDMRAQYAGRESAEFRLEARDEPTTITLGRRD